MKRSLAALLFLMLLSVPAFAEKECWYEYKYGTHDFEQTDLRLPTCTAEGYYVIECRQCGHSERHTTSPALGHDWEKVAGESSAPSCEADGFNVFVCASCGQIKTQTVSRLGHRWQDSAVLQAATCQAEGRVQSRCSRCGETAERTLPRTDHRYGDWGVSEAATDHSAGRRVRTCSVCGAQDSALFDPEGTLRRGARGEDVRALQQMLIDLSFLSDWADGIFGARTEEAVRAYQTASGLTSDGVAWPQTLFRLTTEWQVAQGLIPEQAELPACQILMDEDGAEHTAYCAYHQGVVEMANALLEAADDLHALSAQNQIRFLWQTELDALYDEWQQGVPEEEQGMIVAARATFTSYLSLQESALRTQYRDEIAAVRQINSLLERQCVTLCGMLHGEADTPDA